MEKLIAKLRKQNTPVTLNRAIRSKEVSSKILHYFATDCAERALLRERVLEREPLPVLWQGIEEKRLWVENAFEKKQLIATRKKIETAAKKLRSKWNGRGWWEYQQDTPEEAVWLTASAVYSSTTTSAKNTTSVLRAGNETRRVAEISAGVQVADQSLAQREKIRSEARQADCAWQCRRLAWWLETSLLTERLWLTYSENCPFPPPDDIAIDFALLFPGAQP
mgnify:CR=1 FL=1